MKLKQIFMSEDLSPQQINQLKQQEYFLKQKRQSLIEGLPHLYGYRWFSWAREFYESKNKMCLICASNQSTKSSTQIRKTINWATNKKLWPHLWKTPPRIFFYLYPSRDVATAEFDKKWVPEFLPRNEFKGHEVYGWRAEYNAQKIFAIHFNSGVSIYFRTYSQDPQTLQANSVHAVFTDEELPYELYPELFMRMAATDGYFSMVFTATLGQDQWRRAMEVTGKDELFPDAYKRQISMFDCMYYEDGTPGLYTQERIDKIIQQCGTTQEVQRRVYGKFVATEGRIYPAFDATKHYVKEFELKNDHRIYAGVDIGSGGQNHPPAICFIAVENDLKRGTVFKTWRGDDGSTYTSGDILNKYLEMKGNLNVLGATFDWAAKDFGTIASRTGIQFSKADKSKDVGESLMNTLFKNKMLLIYDTEDNRKLGNELTGLMHSRFKTQKDDLVEATRYNVMQPPWDFSWITDNEFKEEVIVTRPLTDAEYQADEFKRRRGEFEKKTTEWDDLDEDFEFWNNQYGND